MLGVLGVLTGQDWDADGKGSLACMATVASADGTPMREARRPVLVTDFVRHVGDPIAMVIAESLPLAMDASEAVVPDFEPLEATADLEVAVGYNAPLVHYRFATNVAYDWLCGNESATSDAFNKAAKVVELDIVNNRIHGFTLEPRAVAGQYEASGDSYTLWSTTQMPHVIRDCLAQQSLCKYRRIEFV